MGLYVRAMRLEVPPPPLPPLIFLASSPSVPEDQYMRGLITEGQTVSVGTFKWSFRHYLTAWPFSCQPCQWAPWLIYIPLMLWRALWRDTYQQQPLGNVLLTGSGLVITASLSCSSYRHAPVFLVLWPNCCSFCQTDKDGDVLAAAKHGSQWSMTPNMAETNLQVEDSDQEWSLILIYLI